MYTFMYALAAAAAAVLYITRARPGARRPSPPPKVTPGSLPQYDEAKRDDGENPHFRTSRTDEMPIRYSKEGVGRAPATTVMTVFRRAVENHGDSPALISEVQRADGGYDEPAPVRTWTWREYYEDVSKVARALVRLGLQRHDAVNIIGFNSQEWFVSLVGTIAAGGLGVGIYTTNGPQACQYISEHSEAFAVVVENEGQLAKYVEIYKNLPKLKVLVYYRDPAGGGRPASFANFDDSVRVLSWSEFMALGDGDAAEVQEAAAEVKAREADTRPGHCVSLIYTSGTTGNPKAVMISNDNATWTCKTMIEHIPEVAAAPVQRSLSYLPLSHVAAQVGDVFMPMVNTGEYNSPHTVYFARPTALKGTLGVTLKQCRPTLFIAVPRVWEKMQEKMTALGKQTKGLKKAIATWAKGKGAEAYAAAQAGGTGDLPAGFSVANKLVFSKIKQALGLDKCLAMYTAAAPIQRQTLEFFGRLDVPVIELYGMSECTGPQTVSLPRWFSAGACGPSLAGCELKIDHDASRDKAGEGEICYRGRHIMMGYLKNPKKTAEAIDPEGFLHSGDVGRIDEHGMLRITGRIKELLITAGGENIAPVPIEEQLCANLPAVETCMMIGDKRKFNSVLFTLKSTPDEKTGGFTDQLAGDAATAVPGVSTVTGAIKSDAFRAYLQAGIDKYNKTAVSRAQCIQKFAIVPGGFSVPGGELTPTLKLKRPVVLRKHAEMIEAFYQ